MDFDVDTCPSCSCVCIRLAGPFCSAALLDAIAAVEAVGDPADSRTEVWDVRDIRELYIKPAEVQRLNEQLPAAEEKAPGRTAVIARTNSHASYGTVLCRSLRPYAQAHRPFFSVDRAMRWLDCGPTAAQEAACLLRSD